MMGGGPDEYPKRYAVADPLAQVPIPASVRCVHARADEAATAAGQDAPLLEVDGGHFSITDICSPTWPTVVKALGSHQRPTKSRVGRPAAFAFGVLPAIQLHRVSGILGAVPETGHVYRL